MVRLTAKYPIFIGSPNVDLVALELLVAPKQGVLHCDGDLSPIEIFGPIFSLSFWDDCTKKKNYSLTN